MLILYDGHCLLCNRFIRNSIAADKDDLLRAAPLQTYSQLESKPEIDESIDSVILISPEGIQYKSDAVLSIKSKISSTPWFFTALNYIPSGIRNFIYDFIARNRYRWFGRADECVIPSKEVFDKFLMKKEDLQQYLNGMTLDID